MGAIKLYMEDSFVPVLAGGCGYDAERLKREELSHGHRRGPGNIAVRDEEIK